MDNGYDQTDITVMSRCWTGWRADLVDFTNVYNPFALVTTSRFDGGTDNNYTNLNGA